MRIFETWRSPIHMPRWASRLTLEITDIRVERLQEISEEDAIREGIGLIPDSGGPNLYTVHIEGAHLNAPTAKQVFARLWDTIHGEDAWDANPYVWVISFKVISAPTS